MELETLLTCDIHLYSFPRSSVTDSKLGTLRDRPFNLKGGGMVFCFFQNFFSDNTSYNKKISPEFNIRLYDKNSESDYFFFLHQNQNIFFSNIGNQNIFLEKKHNSPLQVKWSFPKKSLKIPKEQSETVYRRRTDNTMAKRKGQKDKQRSTKYTYKTKDRVTRTPLTTGGELRCSGRVSSSCSTSSIRRVDLVTRGGSRVCSKGGGGVSRRGVWGQYTVPSGSRAEPR